MKDLKTYICESQKQIQGLPGYTYEEVCLTVEQYVENIIEQYDLEIELLNVELHGSRLRGQAKPTSDLDAVVEYKGNMKEYALFNIIKDEEQLTIEDIEVDINPIRKQESGTMAEYMKKSAKYDKEKLQK